MFAAQLQKKSFIDETSLSLKIHRMRFYRALQRSKTFEIAPDEVIKQ